VLDLPIEELPAADIATATGQLATAWHAPLTKTSDDLRTLLDHRLENYKLSATHLNTFIDLVNGNPEQFLLKYLLKFPTAQSPAAAYGTAIHTALQRAHAHLTARGDTKPLEDVLGDFTDALDRADLNQRDWNFYLKKGVDTLTIFYEKKAPTFAPTDQAEQHFNAQLDSGARLTGLIDLISIDKKAKTLTLTDYKTGKAAKDWRGQSDYEKIKLHKYRQQLLFYKLLLENSREFAGYTVEKGIIEFVEPRDGQLLSLEFDYNGEEIAEFTDLVNAIWTRIIALDLPDVTDFPSDFAGILQFEQFLLKNS
jgi:DNA helicase-2/ATP-dependent DNA helicase PcrA